MTMVFADTLYWIAIARPGDQWNKPALRARGRLGEVTIVTTHEILVEFLNGMAKGGPKIRDTAAQMVDAILTHPVVRVVAQSYGSFAEGLELYSRRPDKDYSLTDCISMNTMTSLDIQEVLTVDHHFTQEGFTVLMAPELS